MKGPRPKVAFICVHNSCRSQIAEALGKLHHKDVFVSFSAGTSLKKAINGDAVRLVRELYCLDMEESQYPKLIEALPPVDIVVTMGCAVDCPTLACSHREDWGLDDPTGQDDAHFLAVIRTIEDKLEDLAFRIVNGRLL